MLVSLEHLTNITFPLKNGDRIFLHGNLGAGKTTLCQELIRAHLKDTSLVITSPTYTYYQKYGNIYHFDLYRVQDMTDIMRIGADEIFDDPDSICLIEWPEKIIGHVSPTKIIDIQYREGAREITITDVKT